MYDSSAKREGKLFDDIIHSGPKLQQDLINVLLRFGRYPIVLVCDLAEMYLRIGIRPIGRPYQRIPKVLQLLRVVFGINSSPFLVQFVSGRHAIKKKTEITRSGRDCPLLKVHT